MKFIATPVKGQRKYDPHIGWTMRYDGERWAKHEKGCERFIAEDSYNRAFNKWSMRLGLVGEKPKWEDFYDEKESKAI